MLSVKDLLSSVNSVSITRNKEIMEQLVSNQDFFDEMFQFMWNENKKIRRAASVVVRRALEINPGLNSKHRKKILNALERNVSDEIKWCVALMFKNLKLDEAGRQKVFTILMRWSKEPIGSGSQAACIQGMADVAMKDKKLLPVLIDELNSAVTGEQPALKARARNLLKDLRKVNPKTNIRTF